MLHNLKKQKLIILTFLHSPGKCRIRRTFYNWALSEGVPWSSSYWLNDRLEWMLHMLSTAERRNRWREREKGRGGREKAIILIYVYGKYEIYLYITNIRRSNNNNKDGENVLIFQMFIWWFLSFRHCPLPTPIPPYKIGMEHHHLVRSIHRSISTHIWSTKNWLVSFIVVWYRISVFSVLRVFFLVVVVAISTTVSTSWIMIMIKRDSGIPKWPILANRHPYNNNKL